MKNEDCWLAADKIYHVLFCFTLTLFFSSLATQTRYLFIRRHFILIGSLASLSAGAAKEFADQLGFFHSAGASAKDALADLVGVLIASFTLYFLNFLIRIHKQSNQSRDILMV